MNLRFGVFLVIACALVVFDLPGALSGDLDRDLQFISTQSVMALEGPRSSDLAVLDDADADTDSDVSDIVQGGGLIPCSVLVRLVPGITLPTVLEVRPLGKGPFLGLQARSPPFIS